jgi:phytoene/squalene synthetase
MIELFNKVSEECSRITTKRYSTSFASAIKLLHKKLRQPVYNIYGFVRFADEIVDTFHDHDKEQLLNEFKKDTYIAIERGISLNPILNSFQKTVNQYSIDHKLIDAFLQSMQFDLQKKNYNQNEFENYIYGSAEAVGLMCLHVFCNGNKELFEQLREPARSLGAAFQKVNFLRDIKSDFNGLSRMYFPGCDFNNFTNRQKREIEGNIQLDFQQAYIGIVHLPFTARFGVYVAYKYYMSLFKKIKKLPPSIILESRIRVPDYMKLMIVLRAGVKNKVGLI